MITIINDKKRYVHEVNETQRIHFKKLSFDLYQGIVFKFVDYRKLNFKAEEIEKTEDEEAEKLKKSEPENDKMILGESKKEIKEVKPENIMIPIETMFKINSEVVKLGIIDWEGMYDQDGEEIKFDESLREIAACGISDMDTITNLAILMTNNYYVENKVKKNTLTKKRKSKN